MQSQDQMIIFRNELLNYSETFIPAQVNLLSKYQPCYVGTKVLNTQLLGNSQVIAPLDGKSKLYRLLFMLAGYTLPSWLTRLKKVNPKLIHAHFGVDGVFALPLAKKLQIPLVVTFHGYDITVDDCDNSLSGWMHRLYKIRRQLLFKQSNTCIAVSKFIRSKLIEKGCPEDKILVHYIGVDVQKFTPNPDIKRTPVVLFVGRLVEKKGCEYLIKAMSQVQSVLPELELVLIGDGELRSSLEKQASECLTRYRFLGSQSPDVVKNWMNQALLLAAPSVTSVKKDSEGLPICILEAQAMGLPVVASYHAGIPEAIIHGETGFLAAERDWQTLGEHILTLASNSTLRKSFAAEGRLHMEREFNLKLNTKKLEAIYDSILNQT